MTSKHFLFGHDRNRNVQKLSKREWTNSENQSGRMDQVRNDMQSCFYSAIRIHVDISQYIDHILVPTYLAKYYT